MIELIDCPETFYTSVEVTAGSRLFYHVVQNDKLVIRMIAEINKHNLPGEVNFLPINRLCVQESSYPETNVGYLYFQFFLSFSIILFRQPRHILVDVI